MPCAIDGGCLLFETLDSGIDNGGQYYVSDLAAANGVLYWSAQFGQVWSVATDVLGATPRELVQLGGLPIAESVAAVDGGVFITSVVGSATELFFIPADGSGPVNRGQLQGASPSRHALAVDQANVYAITGGDAGGVVAAFGRYDGGPTTLVEGPGLTTGAAIAVADGVLYWTTGAAPPAVEYLLLDGGTTSNVLPVPTRLAGLSRSRSMIPASTGAPTTTQASFVRASGAERPPQSR
jgi:hypothetical protein